MFKRKIITFILLALASLGARAQYDVSFSHYFDMEPSFNAAAVGKQSKLNITAAYAMDFVGFENNPQTMYAAADLPFYFLKGLHGAGLQFMNDKIGLFSHQRLTLQYAYKHKLFGGTISGGLSVGLLSESFDGTKLDAGEAGDPALPSTKVEGSGLTWAWDCTTCAVRGMWECRRNISTRPSWSSERPTNCRLIRHII